MAILLGAFLIAGLQPGPDMLTKHLDVTFSLVWTIVIANIITVLAALPLLKYLAMITAVRSSLLTPLILFLAFLGAFTSNGNVGDLLNMLFFGALGYVMVVYQWPRPPLILGLVLGRISENYFATSVERYGATWLLRPGVLILFSLAAANVLYTLRQGSKGEGTA